MSNNEFYPGKYSALINYGVNQFHIHSETGCVLVIKVISNHIVRIRYSTDGTFEEDFSYALTNRYVPEIIKVSHQDFGSHIEVATEAFKINIQKSDLKITFTENNGKIICRDEKGFHWEENEQFGGNFVKMSKVVQEGEHYYGLGDKTMHLNLRGRRLVNWAMDTYGFKKNEDPIYKAIPFYTAIHDDIGYGIFFDNTFKSHFDFGSERRSVASFWAEGGEMNYYFIHGPQLLEVTKRYSLLTGVPELPPMWVLGYQQCKWSYYPEAKITEVTDKMRELKIPCDAIYFDIDYMDGFRCFTWDKEKFPDPKRLVSALKENGFKSIVIIDPGIKIDPDYPVFKEGLENNYFCRRADGPYMKGKVWPGDCYFPDFTNPKVRKWWSGLFEELIQDIGVSGVWNDMNEPAIFEVDSKTFPDDVRHDYDGHPCSHRKAHNIYGMQMARATYKGVKKYNNNQRPVVITRSAYSGAQRYSATWTGDNIASWEHLWLANVQMQRMAVTGYSFVGSDIGGFIDHPTPELYVRWIQLAVFHPFCRTHSSGDHGDQEPWSFGEDALNIVRKYIDLRYKLLPYIYTAFYQYVSQATPIVRPISIYDQEDKETLYRVDEFLLGDHILVCPVLEPNAKSRYVYFPKGQWYSYWDDELLSGGKEISVDAPLERLPLYVKAGAVIPSFPLMQYVGEKPIDTLTIDVYFGDGKLESQVYEDSGDGYDYEKGIYNIKTFTTESKAGYFHLNINKKGHYDPEYAQYKIVVHGLPFAPSQVALNERQIEVSALEKEGNNYILMVPRQSFLSLEIQ